MPSLAARGAQRLHEGRGLRAAFKLLRGDATGIRQFDTTVPGFFGSFGAIIYALPAFALNLIVERHLIAEAPQFVAANFSETLFVLVEGSGLLLHWLLVPLLLLGMLSGASLSRRYVPLIVALNWSTVIAMTIMAVPPLLMLSDAAPPELVLAIITFVFGWMTYYLWFVIRTALQSTGMVAVVLVLAIFTVDFLIVQVIDHLSHGWLLG
jgi:hypothetical protein